MAASSPRLSPARAATNPLDMDIIMMELKALAARMDNSLPALLENVKAIQVELADLKTLKAECTTLKSSVEFLSHSVDSLSSKLSDVESEMDSLKKTKTDISALQERCSKLEDLRNESEQKLRQNNIEIKGVPMTNSENLFTIIEKIGNTIGCTIPKEQINYIARVPMRNNDKNKNIICSVHNRYIKNNFVAAAKKLKAGINATILGFQSDTHIYVNDHLTMENKILLNKTKSLAKQKDFLYVWVSGCKILIKKNATSPTFHIKTEKDLQKFIR
ncbi:uncharacterized protein LOC121728142 [Aricia agestis]|uniref:uncharacterized protein LOC121728142 n=1 Tax=Aricia agestis TaxID=91739 RepID=UPI001C208EBE|nr:uncharacterized protein LOC121728142 [Aricia agestis]